MDDATDLNSLIANAGKVMTFEAGEKVFLENDTARTMYVVSSGRVDIITFGTILENVGPSGIFGEIALLDDEPRSAAAIAIEPTEVIALSKDEFLAIIARRPEFALHVMRTLAKRIRRMNQYM
jgi:CRP/FNR family cyclic AMP-dependent transcriptional regulator